MKKIAIIGASTGQEFLYKTAKDAGIYSIGFAWEENAICKNIADKFYPISILEMDKIVDICRQENIDGIVSNGSNLTAKVTAYISEKLNLYGNKYKTVTDILNKKWVRSQTNEINGLEAVKIQIYNDNNDIIYPCIVKPIDGGGKKGVSLSSNDSEFRNAIEYAKETNCTEILIEEFIEGDEISVETLSYEGNHTVIQITDKENSGAPHFVEIAHHQPSLVAKTLKDKIKEISITILDRIGYINGAAHIEFKINDGKIFLIEVNPRGGGDEISNQLVELSTGYNYVKAMIDIALGRFKFESISDSFYSGIYFLSKATDKYLDIFQNAEEYPWFYDKRMKDGIIIESKGNSENNGFLLYQNYTKVDIKEIGAIKKLNKLSNGKFLATEFLKSKRLENIKTLGNEEWINKIIDKAEIISYFIENSIIGWLVLYCNDYTTKKAYIADLYVLEKYRKQGISQCLLNNAIFICKQRNFNTLWLYCNNPIAKKLYIKKQFTCVKKDYYRELDHTKYEVLELRLQ